MSRIDKPITELDLMAYADGWLDPLRRQVVEAHLAASPEDASMVEAIVEQNRMLQDALGGIAEEPLPPRFEAVLWCERQPVRQRPLMRVAAAAAMVIASGIGGWWLGASGTLGPDDARVPVFLQALAPEPEATMDNVATGLEAPVAPLDHEGGIETAPPWFSDRVTLELAAPSLGSSFAAPELQRLIDLDGRSTVRFELASPDGRPLALYLQTRPSETVTDLRLVENPAGATAYWRDGPLLWALKGEAAPAELEALARRIGVAIELTPRLGPADAEHTALPVPTGDLAQVHYAPADCANDCAAAPLVIEIGPVRVAGG